MSKKELLLVVVLVAFGLLNDYFYEHRSSIHFNFDNLIENRVSFELQDALIAFREEKSFSAVDKLDVQNAAGEILVKGTDTSAIKLVTVVRVAKRWEEDKEWLLKQLDLQARQGEQSLLIEGKFREESLVNKMRVYYELEVPLQTSISLTNRFGSVSVQGMQNIGSISNRYGNVRIANIIGTASVDLKFGDLDASEVGAALTIMHRYGNGTVKGAGSVRYDGKYCEYAFHNIVKGLEIDDAYSKIDIDGSQGAIVRGRFTSLQAANINGDLNIDNSYRRIQLQDIRGSLVIHGKSNQIDVRNLIGKELEVTNSYQRVNLEGLQLEKIAIDGKYCTIKTDIIALEREFVGSGRYCNWELVFPVNVVPQMLVNNRGGNFTNNSHLSVVVKRNDGDYSFESSGTGPRITIENSYGDILLKNKDND